MVITFFAKSSSNRGGAAQIILCLVLRVGLGGLNFRLSQERAILPEVEANEHPNEPTRCW